MMASLLLVNRKNAYSQEILLKQMEWLYEEIKERDGLTSLNLKPTMTTVRHALRLLSGYVEKSSKKDDSASVKASTEYKNILMLAYYRNNLIHLFTNEAYIACSLKAIGV